MLSSMVRGPWLWLAMLALVGTAHAEARGGGLIWRAPEACPALDEVMARIALRAHQPIDGAIHSVEVEVEAVDAIEGGEPGFVARIAIGEQAPREVRVLHSAHCDELTDAVAVVVARLASSPRRDSAEPAPRPQLAMPAPRPAPPSWGGGLRLLGIGGVGAQPGVAAGGEMSGYVRHGWLFAELAEARWLASSRMRGEIPGGVDIGLHATALRAGWGPENRWLRAWIVSELGSLEADGVGVVGGRAAAAGWESLGAGFGAGWDMAPYARLVSTVEVTVPLQRARFELQDGTELFRTAPVTAHFGLGLELGWR